MVTRYLVVFAFLISSTFDKKWCFLFLLLYLQRDSWERFKSHTLLLEDIEMKSRLVTFIAACTDPFADEIRYHPTCWRKYIRSTSDDYNSIPYQNVQRLEIDQLMFIHVRKVIFQDNEPRTLKGLLDDYNHLLLNHNFPKCERTSTLKSISEKEFGDTIGFHNRFQKNQSCIVYDVLKGSCYIEAINAWGIFDDDLLRNVASRLRNKTKHFANLTWPPHPKHQDNPPDMPEELLKFLIWLKHPSRKPEECSMNNPQIVALGDLNLAYIVNKRTKFQVNIAYLSFL